MIEQATVKRGRQGERRVARWPWQHADERSRPMTVQIDGVQVVPQCGGNPHLAGDMKDAARKVAVLSGFGERRRARLLALGQAWAGAFDALVVYESSGDRAPGQGSTRDTARPPPESLGRAAREILEGARRACRHQRHCKLDVVHALRFALSLCRPGDVVVFSCASHAQWAGALQRLRASA
jgi:cyanophycin synthetase